MWTYDLPLPRYMIDRANDYPAEMMPDGEWIKVEDLVLQTRPLDYTKLSFLNAQEHLRRSGFELKLAEDNRRYGVVVNKERQMVVLFDSLAEIEGWMRGLYNALEQFEVDREGKPVVKASYLAVAELVNKNKKG
jgi:hypothetical protein